MTRYVYILDHDLEKLVRGMVALEPNFRRAVFKPLFTDHLKFLKSVPTSYTPFPLCIFKVFILIYQSRSQLETDGIPQLG